MNETTPLVTHSVKQTDVELAEEASVRSVKRQRLRLLFTMTAISILLLFLTPNLFFPQYNFTSGPRKCVNDESFQDSARRIIPSAFAKLDYQNRQTAEYLISRLGIFAFAYFPLKTEQFTYERWEFDKKNPGGEPPPKDPEITTTSDPVEAVLYFCSSLHIVMGDLEDAQTGSQVNKLANLADLQKKLQLSLLQLLSENISSSLSWEQYFAHPGPFGRSWPDGTVVRWARHAKGSHRVAPEDALFLEKNNRHIGSQLWGKNRPQHGDTTAQAFSRLMNNQIAVSKERYQNIVDLDLTGKGQWADIKILSQDENINVFHKFRKIARTVGMTVETYPEILAALYTPIPPRVLAFANDYFDARIDLTGQMSYGDMFCFSDGDGAGRGNYSFSLMHKPCSSPLYAVTAMIFIGPDAHSEFTPTFFGLSSTDFNSIRAVLLVKGVLLGHREIFSHTFGCPAKHDSYRLVKRDSNTNPFNPAVDNWYRPTFSFIDQDITGTMCELEDYFGSVHDLLVRIQQRSPLVNDNFLQYTNSVAQSLANFTSYINVPGVLDDLAAGLC